MVLVGCLIPILLRNKQKGYSKLDQEEAGADIHMVCLLVAVLCLYIDDILGTSSWK